LVGSARGLIVRYYPGIFLDRLKKIMKKETVRIAGFRMRFEPGICEY
jgi:hypothetical protein